MAFDIGEILSGVKVDTGSRDQIEYISIDRIIPNPDNFYELSGLDDLASNIALCGLQQPLRVRPIPGDANRVSILSGHRRHAALKLLIEEGHNELREVPCIVERGEENPKLTQLKLIYANASTRVMTSAEQSRQAEQVEKLLYELKEDGMEFPGRMRDHVAQACKMSTGKLARLKVIRTKLIPAFMQLWEADQLNENLAYTLAGQTPYRQKLLFEAKTKDGKKDFRCYADWATSIFKEMDRLEKLANETKCSMNSAVSCDHVHVRLNHAADLLQYQGMSCRGCCGTCYNLASCGYSCVRVASQKAALKQKEKDDRKRAAAEKAAEEQPKKDLLSLAYSRVGQLRRDRGVSPEAFVTASLGYPYPADLKRLEGLEAGTHVSMNDRMPGSIWPGEARRLMKTADLLGCSIDYLLGHTDSPNGGAASANDGWRTGDPGKPTLAAAKFSIGEDSPPLLTIAVWNGSAWRFRRGTTIDSKCVGWIPLPSDEKMGY